MVEQSIGLLDEARPADPEYIAQPDACNFTKKASTEVMRRCLNTLSGSRIPLRYVFIGNAVHYSAGFELSLY